MKKIIAAASMVCALLATSATNAQTKKATTRTTKQMHSTVVNARTAKGTAATKKVVKEAQVNTPVHSSTVASAKRENIKK